MRSVSDSNTRVSRVKISVFLLASFAISLSAIVFISIMSESCGFYRLVRSIVGVGVALLGILLLVIETIRSGFKKGIRIDNITGGLSFVVACYVLFFLALGHRIRGISYRVVCVQNISALGKAMLSYASDIDYKFPPAKNWCSFLLKHTKVKHKDFICPESFWPVCGYGYNKNLANLRIEDVSPETVVLFEIECGCNIIGGPELLEVDKHDRSGSNVLFGDFSVKFVRKEDVSKLNWGKPITDSNQAPAK